MRARALTCLPLALCCGCKPPPDAPSTLDDLCSYLFVRHAEEDPEAMLEGMANLDEWLQLHEEQTREGYSVSGLDEETANSLDDEQRSVAGIFGVAVGSVSEHRVDDATYAMVAVDQEEIHGNNYADYKRRYLSDADCFLDQDCARLEATEDYEATILVVTSDNHTHNQYLWLETEQGLAMAHRAWLPYPPEVNVSWLVVEEQFYLDVFLPWGEGHYRLQATWMVNSQDSMDQDAVMNLVIAGMQQHSENLEDWLDEGGG